jgi:diadenosine tetraphosphatase ApaH/serine/threonine PP2A family protein phosphatase
MAIAILSDIHANLEALNTVLASIKEKEITSIYCLGDIVGYGPNPNECVNLVRENCQNVLVGNHDFAAIGRTDVEYFNKYAKAAAYWTRSHLSAENKEYLSYLPFTHQNDQMLMVHASPTNPAHWYYVLNPYDAQIEMQAFSQPLCFIGHSHVPLIYSETDVYKAVAMKLEKKQKYIVNVGSVGQPRDGNHQACYCIYKPEEHAIEYVRLEYDVQKTYAKIIKEGLPAFLAERLLKGY